MKRDRKFRQLLECRRCGARFLSRPVTFLDKNDPLIKIHQCDSICSLDLNEKIDQVGFTEIIGYNYSTGEDYEKKSTESE